MRLSPFRDVCFGLWFGVLGFAFGFLKLLPGRSHGARNVVVTPLPARIVIVGRIGHQRLQQSDGGAAIHAATDQLGGQRNQRAVIVGAADDSIDQA
jgi:hypothetical protein